MFKDISIYPKLYVWLFASRSIKYTLLKLFLLFSFLKLCYVNVEVNCHVAMLLELSCCDVTWTVMLRCYLNCNVVSYTRERKRSIWYSTWRLDNGSP